MNWWQRFNRSSAHTQANIVCTVLMMLATIAYAITAFQQLRAMNSQLAPLQKSSDAAQLSAETSDRSSITAQRGERDTAKASEGQLRQAQQALQATIDNFRQEQRAWLGLSGFAVAADPKTEGISTNEGITHMNTAIASLFNAGHTPARKVLVLAGIGFMAPDHVLDGTDETWIKDRIRSIERGDVHPSSISMGHATYSSYYLPLGNVTIDEVSAGVIPPGIPYQFRPIGNFLGGRFDVVIFGKITYTTADGRIRTTMFCSYRSDTRDTGLTTCPIYNDMN